MDCYTPEIGNPYPTDGWNEIADFKYLTPLELYRHQTALSSRSGSDADYIVSQPYAVDVSLDGRPRRITVPKGMLTDLASVPRFARSVVGRVGPHLEASIVHDYLYIAWQDIDGHGPRKADRDFADRLMLAGMEAARVGGFKRQLIYRTVRTFGWGVYESANPGCRYVVLPDRSEEGPLGEPGEARLIA